MSQNLFTTIDRHRSCHDTRPWNRLFPLDRTGCPHRQPQRLSTPQSPPMHECLSCLRRYG